MEREREIERNRYRDVLPKKGILKEDFVYSLRPRIIDVLAAH